MSTTSHNRDHFQAISPFSLEECLKRIKAEDGTLLRANSAGSQIRAVVTVSNMEPNTAVFRIDEALYFSLVMVGKPKYRGNTGYSVEGRLSRCQGNRTEVYGTIKTALGWSFGKYLSAFVISCIAAGIVGVAFLNYSIAVSVLFGTVIFVSLMVVAIRSVVKSRMRFRKTLRSLLHVEGDAARL